MTNEQNPLPIEDAERAGDERAPVVHEVKCWPEPFKAVKARLKPWELRLNDRDYRVGDTLRQREWDPAVSDYTGDIDQQNIVWALYGPAFGLPEGYVIMTLSDHIGDPTNKVSTDQVSDVEVRSDEPIAWLYTENRWKDGPRHRLSMKRQAISEEDINEFEITETALIARSQPKGAGEGQ